MLEIANVLRESELQRKEGEKGEEWKKEYLDAINIETQLYLSFIMKSNMEEKNL